MKPWCHCTDCFTNPVKSLIFPSYRPKLFLSRGRIWMQSAQFQRTSAKGDRTKLLSFHWSTWMDFPSRGPQTEMMLTPDVTKSNCLFVIIKLYNGRITHNSLPVQTLYVCNKLPYRKKLTASQPPQVLQVSVFPTGGHQRVRARPDLRVQVHSSTRLIKWKASSASCRL